MFQGIGRQIIFFLLSLLIVIKYLIFGNNEIEKDEAENEAKREILEIKKNLEGMSNKIGGMSNKIEEMSNKMEEISNKIEEISNQNEKLNCKINLLFFEQNFMINYHNEINQKSKFQKISNDLRVNYLLLTFSSKVKNIIAFTRIINLRKIVNCLLNRIIEKNKKYLKKTLAKFQDILNPKDNQRLFYIIYCTEDDVNGVTKKSFDIIIDFLMFIHNYTSSLIHLNNIENYQDIIPKIEIHNGENSPKSESNISENKTNYSFYPNDIIDYAFNSYDIEKETKKMIKRIEDEEKQNIEQSKNNNIALPKKKDNLKEENKEKRKDIIINPEEKDEDIKSRDSNDSTKYNQISKENEINKNKKYDERNSIMKNMKTEEIDFQFNNNYNQKQDSQINNFFINNNQNEENQKDLSNNNIIFFDDINANDEKENLKKLKIHFENISKEDDIKIIKKILENMDYNKELDINKLIKVYKDNKNEMIDIRNTIEIYNEKINNYRFEEFSFEKMINIYKSQFDKNSIIYKKSQRIIDQHYRFNSSYNKIIDSNDISNFNFADIKSFIKKIAGNELIDLFSKDQGRYGQELLFEDIV